MPRPGVEEFLRRVFSNFFVTIWSCIDDADIIPLFRYLILDATFFSQLKFIWGGSKCRSTNAFLSSTYAYLLEDLSTITKEMPYRPLHQSLFNIDNHPSKGLHNDPRSAYFFPSWRRHTRNSKHDNLSTTLFMCSIFFIVHLICMHISRIVRVMVCM